MFEQFHDLMSGDHFSMVKGGPVFTVDDANYIDEDGYRSVIYQAQDGIHSHLADHTMVWLIA